MKSELESLVKGMNVAVEMPVDSGALRPSSIYVKLPIEHVTSLYLTVNGKKYKRKNGVAYDAGSNARIYTVVEKPSCISSSQYHSMIEHAVCSRKTIYAIRDLVPTQDALKMLINTGDSDKLARINELVTLLHTELGMKL